jgi:hypothetical protein
MASTLGGDDPAHDFSPEEKDQEEKRLRDQARKLGGRDKRKNATRS